MDSATGTLASRFATQGAGVHAVLLYGAAGSAVGDVARAIAGLWLCPNPTQSGACGDCAVCHSLKSGRAVDLLALAPQGASRWIRNEAVVGGPHYDGTPIVDFVRTGPLMSRHKVVLIEDADRMSSAAANALLKTLEEPPASLKLVLTTTTVSAILPTIVSRCLTIPCALPTPGALAAEFGELEPYEALFSQGSPAHLQRIRRKPEAFRELWRFFETLPGMPRSSALWAAERFRQCAEALDADEFGGARGANAAALHLLALWLAGREPLRPDWVAAAVEAHRRVQGNAAMGAQTDSLFCQVLR